VAAVTETLARAWELVEADDAQGALRHLRPHVDTLDFADLGRLMGRLASSAGFDDLAAAAAALAADPEQPQARYDFGYACIERGVPFLAVPVLRALLRQVPGEAPVYRELVAALEDEWRHAEAVEVLRAQEPALADWPDRYLLAFHALLAGDLALARSVAAGLSEPADPTWLPAQRRLRRLLDRARAAATVSSLDRRDLRGWQFVLTGGVLATLSPYGFGQGMNGRYAFVQDSYATCRHGLARLAVVLAATGQRPQSVGLLPDRSSRILGLAAATVFGLPAEPFRGPQPAQLVVAYQLATVAPELARQLFEPVPGQIVYEHATCWTDPAAVSADASGRLVQVTVPPWGAKLGGTPAGGTQRTPEDERPEPEIAAELAAAPVEPEPGDEQAPPDDDELLARFAAGVRDSWLSGPREAIRSPGPVPSNRFA
jgi:hypothetical protein